jgi:hypothetical protein
MYTAAACGRPLCSCQFTDSNSICIEQTQMAEREFSAFISAVKELLQTRPSFRQWTNSTSWN